MTSPDVLTYLKLLVERLEIPLHRLSELSGLSEDHLLNLLSARVPLQADELLLICEAIDPPPVVVPGEVGRHPPTLRDKLLEIQRMDAGILSGLTGLLKEEARPSDTSQLASWNDKVSELVGAYSAYHTEVVSLLRQYLEKPAQLS